MTREHSRPPHLLHSLVGTVRIARRVGATCKPIPNGNGIPRKGNVMRSRLTTGLAVFVLAILSLGPLLGLTGCVNEEVIARATIASIFNMFKDPTEENLEPYIKLAREVEPVGSIMHEAEQYDVDVYELTAHLLKHYDYEIHDVSINGNSGSANLTITHIDPQAATEATFDAIKDDTKFNNDVLKKAINGDMNGVYASITNKFYDVIDATENTTTTDLNVELTKKDAGWNVTDESIQDFISNIYEHFDMKKFETKADEAMVRFTLTTVFDAYKNVDKEILSVFIDAADGSGLNQLETYGIDPYEYLGHIFKHFEYEVGDITVNGNKATASVTLTNANFQSIMDRLNSDVENDANFRSQLEEKVNNNDEKGFYKVLFDHVYKLIDESDDLVTTKLNLHFTKTNGVWDVDESSLNDFAKAVLGDFNVSV